MVTGDDPTDAAGGENSRGGFRPWRWFAAWLAGGLLAAVLVGGGAGIAIAILVAVSGFVVAEVLWRATREPTTLRPAYVADHPPTLVFRAVPQMGLPAWLAPLGQGYPHLTFEGESESWTVQGDVKWGRTYAVDAPPGLWTMEVWCVYIRTARLEVELHEAGRLFVEYRPTWWYTSRLRWQPKIPDGVVLAGKLTVKKDASARRRGRRAG